MTLLIRAATRAEQFAGPGASLAIGDQYRYLSWIRDAAGHGLISGTVGGSHVYLNPVFLISGLLVRAGISIQLAYQLWLPVAIGALFAGYRALVWRTVAPGLARAVTLALALMASSPLLPLFDYGKVVDANGASNLIDAATHLSPYWQAWGYFPTAIALGVMPLYVLDLGRERGQLRLGRLCVTGSVVALLDPWAGLTLVLLTATFLTRDPRALVKPLLATLAPVGYYFVLAQSSADWALANLRASFAPGPVWVLPVVFGPLLVAVAFARPERRDRPEALLWLWLVASVIVFALLGANARLTALEGTSLPLAILAVRGWQRLRLPIVASITAVALMIVPGAVYAGATFHDYVNDNYGPYTLANGERAALRAAPPGRLLATPYLAPALLALDGRRTVDARGADELFDGKLGPSGARALIAATNPAELISDCLPGRADLASLLSPLGYRQLQYGCASVYLR